MLLCCVNLFIYSWLLIILIWP